MALSPFIPANAELKDIQSMLEIVTDIDIGANFVILLIVRRKGTQEIEATATAFLPNNKYFECNLIMES